MVGIALSILDWVQIIYRDLELRSLEVRKPDFAAMEMVFDDQH